MERDGSLSLKSPGCKVLKISQDWASADQAHATYIHVYILIYYVYILIDKLLLERQRNEFKNKPPAAV